MDRNREGRRASLVGSNGFNRRRQRSNSLRDSPDEDGGVELQESIRLRDRVKRDRDLRERDLIERSSRSKRRKADESSEDSGNDDEDNEYEETTTSSGVRLIPPPPGFSSNNHSHHNHNNSSFSHQQHSNFSNNNINNHHLQHRKNFPPSSAAKVFRAPPVWKTTDEMISFSVPRKARSSSTKKTHDLMSSSSNNNSGGGGGAVAGVDQVSTSPARQVQPPAPPLSPSSSNASSRKKLKHISGNNGGQKLNKPPKASSKPSSSNPEELEIEIAEVLYGLMTQSSQGLSSKKEDSKEVLKPNNDAISSPISNSTSANNLNLGSSPAPLTAVAPKRKRPRQVSENSSCLAQPVKPEMDLTLKREISLPSPNLERISESNAEIGYETRGNSLNTQGLLSGPPEPEPMELRKPPVAEVLRESKDLVAKEEMSSPKEKDSHAVRSQDNNRVDSISVAITTENKGISHVSEMKILRKEKFQIDLMVPPPHVRPFPERDTRALTVDQKPALSTVNAEMKDKEDEKLKNYAKNVGILASENNKGRNLDLELNLEKPESGVNAAGAKSQQQQIVKQKQQLSLKATREESLTEKSGQSTSTLPLPMSMANWPAGLPPMGYIAPLQGVVPMETATMAPAPIQQAPFGQPRPKRCATHCYIAQNIHSLQQIMKMNPFWPAAAGSASLFGSKPCNLSVMPVSDLNGTVVAAKSVNNAQDKGLSGSSLHNNHDAKDRASQSAGGTSDPNQRKQQILFQQALPPVGPTNLLGPAFIFPMSQQQAAVAAVSARPAKSSGGAVASSTIASSATATASAPAMSFNFPGMAVNETQYMAFLQNNGYPYPMQAVVPPPNYCGTPGQPMPLFNGSFYASPMIHSSQIQHQQPPPAQSGGSASSQKHSQSQQQRQRSSGAHDGPVPVNVELQNFSAHKSPPAQQLQNQQYLRPRHEGDMGNVDSDGRGPRPSMSIYGQNFPMAMNSQTFALMSPPSGTASGGNNQSEKKSQQTQHPGQKPGTDFVPPHSFAMSFGPIIGANAGPVMDITSMAQNHAFFQNLPEAARQNMQMMAAAAGASQSVQKKNFRNSEDGKTGDSSATDDERKNVAPKAQGGGGGQSIAYTRSNATDQPVTIIESSVRSLNNASGPPRNSQPATSKPGGTHIQTQNQQQHQMAGNPVIRNKAPVTSNGNIYFDHLTKFPNTIPGYNQNHVQNNNSPTQSPQWKSSARPPASQPAPSSLASITPANPKSLPQQHSRTQPQMHTQISFGGSQKSLGQSQTTPSNNQVPSPPVIVGSPTSSSVSKGASGSPRMSNNKMGQVSALSAQQTKSSANPNQKSSSILGNPQMPKNMQQAQLYFSTSYAQAQSPHSTGSSSGQSGYYMQQRKRPEQNQQSSGGMLLPAGYSYVHHAPAAAVQVKPAAEQKQPAGNENLQQWQPEKK